MHDHEGRKDHKCDCGKEYTEKRSLRTHIKRDHENVREEQS